MDEQYLNYKKAVAGQSLPLLLLDLASLANNAAALSRMAGDKPIRIATKSVRSRGIMRWILDRYPQFRGVMAYSAAEAAFLASHGFDDILVGYPSLEGAHLADAAIQVKNGCSITFMISEPIHVSALATAAEKIQVQLPVCIDIDHSLALPGLLFGVRRSKLRSAAEALTLARAAETTGHLSVRGLMGYEAQIAGVADNIPGQPLRSLLIRALKRLSWRRIHALRAELQTTFKSAGVSVSLFNGGGTGSVHLSKDDPFITEVTAGSGLFAPTLFDSYADFRLRPALAFALRVSRQPSRDWITCSSGGFIASGAVGPEKAPTPWLPSGLRFSPLEGAGEVQTPLTGQIQSLQVGDPVFFRHAKAGEVCEHFNEIHMYENGALIGSFATYRGEGQRF